MKLFKYFEERTKKLGMWDIAFIKWATFVFALLFAKLFPVLLSAPVWFYVVVAVLLVLKPMYIFYFKR